MPLSTISAISWQSVLLAEETRAPRENHRPVASHWQLYHKMLYQVHLIYNRDCCLHLYWQRKHYCRKNLSILTNREDHKLFLIFLKFTWNYRQTTGLPPLSSCTNCFFTWNYRQPLDYLPCCLVQKSFLRGIIDKHCLLVHFFTRNYRQLLDYLPCLLVQSFFFTWNHRKTTGLPPLSSCTRLSNVNL